MNLLLGVARCPAIPRPRRQLTSSRSNKPSSSYWGYRFIGSERKPVAVFWGVGEKTLNRLVCFAQKSSQSEVVSPSAGGILTVLAQRFIPEISTPRTYE